MILTPRQDEGWSYQEGWRANKAPSITRSLVTGAEQVGETLTARIEGFSDPEDDGEGVHIYQWYRATNSSGSDKEIITLAITSTYVLEAGDEAKYVACGIQPVSLSGASPGTEVISSWKGGVQGIDTGNNPPSFSSVTISGDEFVGSTLTATLNGYSDAEGDLEGTHLYQWWRADSAAGLNDAAISGATSYQYVLTSSDEDKYISCYGTPVALTGSSPGNAVQSSHTGIIGNKSRSNDFLYDQSFVIDDGLSNGDYVGTVYLYRGKADTTETFSLTGGDITAVSINSSTGVITVIDDTQLSSDLQVTVTGTLSNHVDDTCTIDIQVYTIQNEYFVQTDGNNGNTGTSAGAANAWATIDYAASQATAGDKVWIKAGDYGAEEVVIDNSGTSILPIVFEGYKTTTGDITDHTESFFWDWTYTDALDSSEMPFLSGPNLLWTTESDAIGIYSNTNDYVYIKNIQLENYWYAMRLLRADYCRVENMIMDSMKGTSPTNPSVNNAGWGIQCGATDSSRSYYCLVSNLKVLNVALAGISTAGNYNKIDYCYVWCNDTSGDYRPETDYYVTITDGNYNELTNNYVERVTNTDHVGHGINVNTLSVSVGTHDNLVKYCTAKNFDGESFVCRHRQSYNNVFEDCNAVTGSGTDLSGIVLRDGSYGNTFRRCRIDGMENAIAFYDTAEDGGTQNAGHDNTFEYCIFQGTTSIAATSYCIDFNVYSSGYNGSAYDNKWINCVFDGGDYLINSDRPNSGNELINCIITDVTGLSEGTESVGMSYINCDFYNNGFSAPSGTNIITSNPDFVDGPNNDYRLQSGSPCINAGTDEGLTTDFYENPIVGLPDIGAFEGASAVTPVTNITVTSEGGATTISVDQGTLQMYAAILPVDASVQTVTWSVIAGTGTASISQAGLLQALTDGTVTVRATANDGSGIYDDFAVTISNQLGFGPSLLQSGKGDFATDTEGWVAFDSNTIAAVASELVVTYVDNNRGASNTMRASTDLTTDLTIGKTYRLDYTYRVSAGDSFLMAVYDGSSYTKKTVDQTSLTADYIDFTAASITPFVRQEDMAATEVFYLDSYNVREKY